MIKRIYQVSKNIALLFAGALIGVAAIPYGDGISKNIFFIIIVLIALIFYGAGFLDGMFSIYFWVSRKKNRFLKEICIYAPYEIDTDTSSWVDVSLRKISHILDSRNIRYSIDKKESVFKKHQIIVNPYGGVYPESDISNLVSLDSIFLFVRNGGVYLNIADIPFYYAYDKNLQRRIDTTPLAGDFQLIRSFLQTVLTKKLHCLVFALKNGDDFKGGIERIIELPGLANNLFEKDISIDETGAKYSPVLKIPYGKGYFVFSTFRANEKNLYLIADLLVKSLELVS